MHKLGFWNRIALVSTGLFLIVLPVWATISQIQTNLEARETGYEICLDLARAMEARGEYEESLDWRDTCNEDRFQSVGPANVWREVWPAAALATLIGCAILYALIFAAISIVKWIWRGRQVGKN